MMDHKICLHGEIWLITPKLSLLPLPIWSTVEGSRSFSVRVEPMEKGSKTKNDRVAFSEFNSLQIVSL